MHVRANLPGLAEGQRYADVDGALRDRHLDRAVDLAPAEGAPEAFIAAVRAAAALAHPAIPPLLDLAVDADGRLYAVAVQPAGTPLPELPAGAAGDDARLQAAAVLAEALAYAHGHGVTHGAIAPGLIRLGGQGAVLSGWRPWLAGPPAADVAALATSLRQLLGSAGAVALPVDAAPADAAALATHLRRAIDQRAADALCAAGEGQLGQSGEEAAARAELAFADALARVPGLVRAERGRSRAREARARAALGAGDPQRAAGCIDPADPRHEQIVEECTRALRRRHRGRGRSVLVVLLALAIVAGAGAWWTWRLGAGQPWQVTVDRDFADPSAATDGITIGFTGPAPLVAARREAAGHILMRNSGVLQLPAQDSSSVRLTAVIEWPERVDGFEIGLRASPYAPRSWWEAPPSYMCQFGGYGGARTFVVAHRREGTPEPPTEVALPWSVGRRYTVVFEVDRNRLVQRVDGRVVLELYEPLAVGDDTYRSVFLRSWAPSLRLHSLRLERVDEAVRPNPLAAGDALAGAGLHRRAVDAYLRMATTHVGSEVAEEALAKAAIAAIGEAAEPDLAPELITRLEAAHPGSPLLRTCEEALAAARYAIGDAKALDLAERVQQRHSGSRIGEILLRNRPAEPRAADAARILVLLARAGQAKVLALGRLDIADLAPLAPLRLETLYAGRNRIADLSPLAGMPLGTLDVSYNPLAELSPLAKLPMQRLDLNGTAVTDLSALSGMRLTSLSISDTRISDLAPLSGLPLVVLYAAGTPLVDLSPLRGMALQQVNLGRSAVSDLAPLAGNPALGYLDLTACAVRDLSPLRGARLEFLELAWSEVGDLAPLAGMPIGHLGARNAPVADLSPLAGSKLNRADLRGTRVVDLSPLSATALERLWLPVGRFDLAPLSKLPLQLLHCDGPVGPDLARLDKERLIDLRLRSGSGIDLSSLAGGRLGNLDLYGSRVASFEPILRMSQLTAVQLAGATAEEGGLEELADGLRRQGRRSLARQVDIAALLARRDAVRLRELATELPDRRLRLELCLRCGLAEARRLCASLGGRLPVLVDAADQQQLHGMLVAADSSWLDLVASADGRSPLASSAGRPFPLTRLVAAADLLNAQAKGGWHLLRVGTATSIFATGKRDTDQLDQGVVVEWDPQ